jgi:MFS family permease
MLSAPAPPARQPRSARLLAGNWDYLLLWSGGTVSLLGSQISGVAYPLVVLALTGSATKAGIVGTAALVGRLSFRLPAGHLADRWDRRRTMLGADAARGAVLAGIAVAAGFGVLGFPLLIAAAFIENGLGELFRPASTAALRRVVDPDDMAAAVSRLEARSYATSIGGPPLGGLLFGLGRFLPFAADAASYAYSLVSTLLVRTPMAVEPTEHERLTGRLTAGMRWIWSRALIRVMLLSAAGVNLVFTALNLAVIVAARTHGATATQIGTMLAIVGACGFAGALVATRLAATPHPSFVVLGIFWSTSALVPLMAIDANPYILGALLGTAGLLAPTANTVLVSYVITITPDRLQGRVDAAGNFITGIATPVAPLTAGLLLTSLGDADTFLVIGGAMIAITLAATAISTMRHIPRLDQLVPTAHPETPSQAQDHEPLGHDPSFGLQRPTELLDARGSGLSYESGGGSAGVHEEGNAAPISSKTSITVSSRPGRLVVALLRWRSPRCRLCLS